MTNEVSEDIDPLQTLDKVGEEFDASYVGSVIRDTISRIAGDIVQRINAISAITPYLEGTYSADVQRRLAEQHLFQFMAQIDQLNEELRNTLSIAPDLNRPVTITHT